MQRGQTGSNAVGNFTIEIPPLNSTEYRQYQWQYDLVKPGSRIEGYLMYDSSEPDISSPPAFTGVVTQFNKSYGKCEIIGFDSVWLAQMQIAAPGENVNCIYPGGILANGIHSPMVTNFLVMNSPALFDDFSGTSGHFYRTGGTGYITTPAASWQILNEAFYTNGGGGSGTQGPLAMITSNTTGTEALMFFNQKFGSGGVLDFTGSPIMVYQAWFCITPGLPGAGNIAWEASLVIGADNPNNFQNGYLFQVIGVDNGSSAADVHCKIFQKSAGAYTLRSNDATAFSAIPSTFNNHNNQYYVQVTATISPGQSTGLTGYNWRILINGKDSGCIWNNTTAPATAVTGWFGLRSIMSTTAGTQPQVACERALAYSRNGPSFKQGIVSNQGSGPFMPEVNIATNGQTFIDLWNQAATADSYIWRKRAAQFQDFIDFFDPTRASAIAPVSGLDSTQANALEGSLEWIPFEEDYNIIDFAVEANLDSLATAVQISSNPVGMGNGIIDWQDFHNMTLLGTSPISGKIVPFMLTDSSPSVFGLGSYQMFQQTGINLSSYKGTPNNAKSITVLRDPLWADRIQLFFQVGIYAPKALGITQGPLPQSLNAFAGPVTATVIGWNFVENSPVQEFLLDQFSFQMAYLGDRKVMSAMDIIARSFAQR